MQQCTWQMAQQAGGPHLLIWPSFCSVTAVMSSPVHTHCKTRASEEIKKCCSATVKHKVQLMHRLQRHGSMQLHDEPCLGSKKAAHSAALACTCTQKANHLMQAQHTPLQEEKETRLLARGRIFVLEYSPGGYWGHPAQHKDAVSCDEGEFMELDTSAASFIYKPFCRVVCTRLCTSWEKSGARAIKPLIQVECGCSQQAGAGEHTFGARVHQGEHSQRCSEADHGCGASH